MTTDSYEIYAVRYAHHGRRASGNFLAGDPHDGPVPLDYFAWAIVGATPLGGFCHPKASRNVTPARHPPGRPAGFGALSRGDVGAPRSAIRLDADPLE
jgi:hypothetical protein